MLLVLVRIATAVAVLVWIVVGAFVGIDYGLADESTARAQAPALAVFASYLVPLAGGAFFLRATLLARDSDRIPVRRCVAGGVVCLLVWLVALVVLTTST